MNKSFFKSCILKLLTLMENGEKANVNESFIDGWYLEVLILLNYQQGKMLANKGVMPWLYENLYNIATHNNYTSIIYTGVITHEQAKSTASQMLKDGEFTIVNMKTFLHTIQSSNKQFITMYTPQLQVKFSGYFTKFLHEIHKYRQTAEIDISFANYKILNELGRGGMGVVYKAQDIKLQRFVALKVISGSGVAEKTVNRFILEIKTIAALQHNNIVKIYEYGMTPKPYFSMEYIDGKPLAEKIPDLQFRYDKIVDIMIKMCQALEQIHNKKIVHRDIKPDNIMITDANEPKLMDFGLAKNIDSYNSLSQQGEVIGTPIYMSPEQALGKSVDPRTDIYSLGATLYEMLTAQPPFRGKLYVQIAYEVVHRDPVSPRILNSDIPIELELICMKCLEKSKNKRYQSATDLIRDLQNFLQNKPISIKSRGLYRLKKWCYRHKFQSVFIVFCILFSLMISWLAYQKFHTSKQLQKLNAQLQNEKNQKEQALQESKKRLVEAHLKMAEYQYYRRDMQSAEAELRMIADVQITSPRKREYINYLQKYAVVPQTIKKQSQYFFPQSNFHNYYASNKGYLVMMSKDRSYVWKYPTDLSKKLYHTEGGLYSLHKHFFSYYNGKVLRVTNLETGASRTHSVRIEGTSFAQHGNWVISKARRKLLIYNLENNQRKAINTQQKVAKQVPLIFFGDGKYFIAGIDSSIGIWRLVNNREWKLEKDSFSFLGKTLTVLAISPTQKELAYGDQSGNLHIINLEKKETATFRMHDSEITTLAYSSDGRLLTSGDRNGRLIIWDTLSQKPIKIHEVQKYIHHVFFPKPHYLSIIYTTDNKDTLTTWHIERDMTGLHIQDKQAPLKFALNKLGADTTEILPSSIHFSNNGHFAALAYGSALSLWNIQSGKHSVFLVDKNWLHELVGKYCFSDDSKMLAIVYRNGRLVVLQTDNLQVLCDARSSKIQTGHYQTGFLAFAPNNENIFLQLRTKQKKHIIFNYSISQKQFVQKIAFPIEARHASFNNKEQLSIGDVHGKVSVMSLKNNQLLPDPIFRVQDHSKEDIVTQIVWSQDCSQFLIYVRRSSKALLFKYHNGAYTLFKEFPVAKEVNFAQFSPDNKHLALFEYNRLYVHHLKYDFRIELACGYHKSGVAAISKDWKWLAFPSTEGQLLVSQLYFYKKRH